MFASRYRRSIARSIVAIIGAGFIQVGISLPVANAAPLAAPTITSSSVTATSMTVNLQTSGFAATSWRYIVNRRQTNGCATPVTDGAVQSTSSLDSSITISGLTEGCYYTVKVAGFNGSIGSYAAVEKLVNGYFNGLKGYHKNENTTYQDFTRVPFTTGTCSTEAITSLSREWGLGRPGTCDVDHFTSYFVGYIKAPHTGTVTFNSSNDDGMQLNIQGQNVLFGALSNSFPSGSISMVANEIYRIEIWFHEYGGGASFAINWSYGSQPSTPVPSANLASDPSVFFGTCPIGLDARCAAGSALEIKRVTGTNMDGHYWININGTPTLVFCVMNSSQGGGGWMLAMRGKNASSTFKYNSALWTNTTLLNESYPQRFTANDTIDTYRNTDAKYAPFTGLPGNQVMVLYPEVDNKAGGAFGTNGSANPSGVNSVKYGFAWHETFTTGTEWTSYNSSTKWGGNSWNVAHTDGPTATPKCVSSAKTLNNLFNEASRCAFRRVSSNYVSNETPYSAVGDNVFFSQTNIRFFGINYGNASTSFVSKARIGFGWNENGPGEESSNDGNGGIGLMSTNSTSLAAGTYNGCCSGTISSTDANTAGQTGLSGGDATTRQLGFELYVRNSIELTVSGNSTLRVTKGRLTSLVAGRGYFVGNNTGTTTLRLSTVREGFTIDPTTGVVTVSEALPIGTYTTTVSATDANNALGVASLTINVIADSPETDMALSFNGSQFMTTAGTVGLWSDQTWEAWVRPTANCEANASQTVLGTTNFVLFCNQSNWWVSFQDSAGAWQGKRTSLRLVVNEWVHLAVVRSGTNISMYANNKQLKILNGSSWVDSYSQTIRNEFPSIYVGGTGASGQYFTGQIDEIKVWNEARTLTQIWSGAHVAENIGSSGLLMYWDFNEGTGSAVSRGQRADSNFNLTPLNESQWVSVATPSTDGPYTLLTVPRTLINSIGGWRAPDTVTAITALVLGGGGGGGGGYQGGGGGAGGFLESTVVIDPRSVYPIRVGVGGIGASNPMSPTSGDSSTAFGVSALGGGAGGAEFVISGAGVGVAHTTGGSGGGGGWSSGGTGSAGTAGQGFAGGNAPNLESPTCSPSQYAAAGGGGAGGTGFAPTCLKGGNGGEPKLSAVTGTRVAGGGGGSLRSATATSHIGYGSNNTVNNGGNSGYVSGALVGATGGATNGSPGTGTGGGAGMSSDGTTGYGAAGGSGVVTFRWITAQKPVFTQPTNDTTTAGLTDTITVSANPISPLIRNYQWQVSTDTGTTWANASTGSGITGNTYTTPILETTTSGSRFQYRVVVTDSDTAGLSIVETSTHVFIVVNPRITFSGTFTPQKYGELESDTFTVLNGTGNKTFTYSPGNRPGITWSSPSANTAVVTVARTVSVGTYPETITATDTRGAQTQFLVSVVVTKADTITVTTLSRSETYTGSAFTFTPSFTVVGLKNSDTVTPISWEYAGADNVGTIYSTSAQIPTNAGSYTITPVTPASLLDSYTAVTRISSNLTINRAARTISLATISSPMKYGETRTAVATPSAGVGDGTISYLTSTSDSCSVTSATITAIRSAGTCSFTAIISRGNNFETATTTSPVTTTLSKADTITVQLRNPVTLTYNANPAASLPTLNIVGLVHTDTATATRIYSHPASIVGAPESYPALTDSSVTPTNAETYTVSSLLTFSSGASTNYQNIVNETSTLIINQANQQPLRIAMYGAFIGSPYTIITDGGTGSGIVTETTTAGSSADNCSINARMLTTTSTVQSFCNILVTKAATRNYKVETTTAQITFYLFIPTVPPPPPVSNGPVIVLQGLNTVTVDAEQAPTFASLSASSGAIGSNLRIYGTGFYFADPSQVEIEFSRTVLASTYTLVSDSEISVTVPVGATTARIVVRTPRGMAPTSLFTILP